MYAQNIIVKKAHKHVMENVSSTIQQKLKSYSNEHPLAMHLGTYMKVFTYC